MSIHDYLIDHAGIDWPKLLTGWSHLLPRELTVWLMNRFGDLFLVFSDGSVHMLDVGSGTVQRVAGSRDEFRIKIDQGDNANQWLMIPLVEDIVAAGKLLGPGQCYGYKLSPLLGGEFSVRNTAVISINEHYDFNSYLQNKSRICPTVRKLSSY